MPIVSVGDNDYVAFADLDWADEYLFADVQRGTVWALKNADLRGRGLVSATRLMLRLPWVVTPDPDDPGLLPVIKEVSAMLAADLVAQPKLFADASGNSNIKMVKGGPAQVEFFAPIVGGPPLPRAQWDMLVAAGLMGGVGDGSDEGAYVGGLSSECRPLTGRYGDDVFLDYAARDFG